MERIALFSHKENDLKIYYYPEHKILQTYVSGKVKHEVYKLCNEKCLDFVREKKVKRVIYDQTDIISTDMMSRAWYTASYLPRIFKELGTDFTGAIVKSQSNFENATVDFMIKAARALGLKNKVAQHNSLAEALEWIKEN